MNRKEIRIRNLMARETKYVKDYVEHLPVSTDIKVPGVHHVVS